MRFNKVVSFNSHDTVVVQGDDGRIVLDRSRGVALRCELVINAITRMNSRVTAAEVSEHLNKRLRANYSEYDVRYALNRLTDQNLIKTYCQGKHRFYAATPQSLALFRRVKE